MQLTWETAYLLSVCLLSLGGGGYALYVLLINARKRRSPSRLVSPVSVTLASLWAIVSAGMGFPLVFTLTAGVLAILGAVFLGAKSARLRWLCSIARPVIVNGYVHATLLLFASTGLLLWAAYRPDPVEILEVDASYTDLVGHLLNREKLTNVDLRTDRGRCINAFTVPYNESLEHYFTDSYESTIIQSYISPPKVLHVGPPNPQFNCHGFVFTAGRYVIEGADVPTILDDNGYKVVQKPQPGDVVVYRDTEGNVVHTGLVHSIGIDASILIESKWGSFARYIHAPLDQPYGQTPVYYHTARSSHHLLGLDSSASEAAESEAAAAVLSTHP